MAYNASQHTTTNKPLGIGSGASTDARSQFYEENFFLYRDYRNLQEVYLYLDTPSKREGKFPIFVNSGGNYDTFTGKITGGTTVEYWFKDGVENSNLVLKSSSGTWGQVGYYDY